MCRDTVTPQNPEDWIIKSPDVFVKAFRFTACLTSSRIVLSDAGNGRGAGRDLPLEMVTGIECSRNGKGEPVLIILTGPSREDPRRLIMTFAERPGFLRQGERDTWVQWIVRYRHLPTPMEPVVPVSGMPGRYKNSPPGSRDPGHRDMDRIVPSFIGLRNDPPEAGPVNDGPRRDVMRTTVDVIVKEDPHREPATGPSPRSANPPGRAGSYPPGQSFFCLACGNRVPVGASFCNRCGASLIHPGNEVVRSPWDPARPEEEQSRLAMQWGVEVAPAAGAGQQAVPQGPDRVPDCTSAFPFAESHIPGAGTVAGKRVAILAGILITAVILAALLGSSLLASMTGESQGMIPASPTVGEDDPTTVSPVEPESGATSPGTGSTLPAASSGSGSSFTASDASSAAIPSNGTYVLVQGSGTWEGSYGAMPAIWAVRGAGEKVYKVGETSDSSVTAIFRNTGTTGSGELVVQIYKDGEIVRTGTAGSGGTVTA
ncbi:MAG: zinc ribbon domain-containing protein [Methanoregula sp.]|uniref:zinc ribbon domain-containing protein n=1 Tax=Methanoregula sp. TaxID=2052170 RepID=UPI0025E21BB3|nr:zinc ribbon domain-containing protein [Methanoregula sp.]MCK9632673.1 zinc ribbon domain-containing protein [Methanoregula sp.]